MSFEAGRLAGVLAHGGRAAGPAPAVDLSGAWGVAPRVTRVGPLTLFASGSRVRLPKQPEASGQWVAHHARLDVAVSGVAPDGDPVGTAWRRGGVAALDELFGDWCLAAWDAHAGRLTLARDQCGCTELYYYLDRSVFAFATDLATLQAMPFVPGELDQTEVTRGLLGENDPACDATLLRNVRRLLPGRVLSLVAGRAVVRRYWDPADVAPVRFADPRDYAPALRSIAGEAVRSRLAGAGPVASQLSAGLDSGTVTALAGQVLAGHGRALVAVTATPATSELGGFFKPSALLDEWPLAQATAATVPGVRHLRVSDQIATPVAAIRAWQAAGGSPVRNPSALPWLRAIAEIAREHGCATLLTGATGNMALSWSGPSPAALTVRSRVRLGIPPAMNATIDRARRPDWFRRSAVHPRLGRGAAGRTVLAGLHGKDRSRSGQFEFVRRGSIAAGALASASRIDRIDTLDPTTDRRLISFCLGVPEQVYVDPVSGVNRKLIRDATVGLLPDQVRLNTRRGRQGADLVPQLRASAQEVDEALDELAGGRAADYLDIAHMRRVWAHTRSRDDQAAHADAAIVLTRGLAYGLWINAI